jgi:hypothetical protein
MTTQVRQMAASHLNGRHQHTYEAIFRHPAEHNLEWQDGRSLVAALADVTEGHNASLHVSRNGQTILWHAPKRKNGAGVEDLLAIRHFLERSGEYAVPPADARDVHLFVVIDHHEAKIFRAELHGAVAQRIEPYDPHGFGRHLRSESPRLTASGSQSERASTKPSPPP